MTEAEKREWAAAAPDNRWEPPASRVAWAIQYPSSDPKFGERIMGAYAQDAAASREIRRAA